MEVCEILSAGNWRGLQFNHPRTYLAHVCGATAGDKPRVSCLNRDRRRVELLGVVLAYPLIPVLTQPQPAYLTLNSAAPLL
jgi:hypothetical protein